MVFIIFFYFFLLRSPKQEGAEYITAVSSEMIILLTRASDLFIFLCLVLEKHVYFLLGWPCYLHD